MIAVAEHFVVVLAFLYCSIDAGLSIARLGGGSCVMGLITNCKKPAHHLRTPAGPTASFTQGRVHSPITPVLRILEYLSRLYPLFFRQSVQVGQDWASDGYGCVWIPLPTFIVTVRRESRRVEAVLGKQHAVLSCSILDTKFLPFAQIFLMGIHRSTNLDLTRAWYRCKCEDARLSCSAHAHLLSVLRSLLADDSDCENALR